MSRNTAQAEAASPASVAVGNRVRQLRAKLRLSLRAFAERTDFSPSFISQLENGSVSPSLGSLEKIAEALGVPVRDFFVDVEGEQSLIVRRGDRQHVTSSWSRARLEALGVAGQKLAAMMIVLEPGGRSGKRARAQAKEEFALVTEGQVVLTLHDEEHPLRKGDAAVIPAGALRLWVNTSAKETRVVIVSAL
jgi:transcriptional regulator with XRE-family HTH domain